MKILREQRKRRSKRKETKYSDPRSLVLLSQSKTSTPEKIEKLEITLKKELKKERATLKKQKEELESVQEEQREYEEERTRLKKELDETKEPIQQMTLYADLTVAIKNANVKPALPGPIAELIASFLPKTSAGLRDPAWAEECKDAAKWILTNNCCAEFGPLGKAYLLHLSNSRNDDPAWKYSAPGPKTMHPNLIKCNSCQWSGDKKGMRSKKNPAKFQCPICRSDVQGKKLETTQIIELSSFKECGKWKFMLTISSKWDNWEQGMKGSKTETTTYKTVDIIDIYKYGMIIDECRDFGHKDTLYSEQWTLKPKFD